VRREADAAVKKRLHAFGLRARSCIIFHRLPAKPFRKRSMASVITEPSSRAETEARAFHTFDTHPDRYAHWRLSFDGPVATLTLDVDEDRGTTPGYKLKLNSYDLGVDIELADALQRIRFEHPEAGSVVITSGRERIFCSGANIFMLGLATHAWK